MKNDTPPETEFRVFSDAEFRQANRLLRLPEDALEAVIRAAGDIRRLPEVYDYARRYDTRLFVTGERGRPDDGNVPSLREWLRDNPDLVGAVVLISRLPFMIDFYKSRGIPETVAVDTLSDLKLWMSHYHRAHGRWGLYQVRWHAGHLTGRLFRLGRLQFAPEAFSCGIRVYRSRRSGRVLALSEGGIRYTADGLRVLPGEETAGDVWTAAEKADGIHICGNPIHPLGYALSRVVSLDAREWEPVLAEGDRVLVLHIPADGRLDPSLCRESLRQATAFFARCFPSEAYRAFVCNTWLFDFRFQTLLPETSNIVKFQREFYLVPIADDDSQVFLRVFGEKPSDLSSLPQDTALRQAILRHYEAGKSLRSAAGFILREDLDWGRAVYQSGLRTPVF